MNRDKRDKIPSMQVSFIDAICTQLYEVILTILLTPTSEISLERTLYQIAKKVIFLKAVVKVYHMISCLLEKCCAEIFVNGRYETSIAFKNKVELNV